MFSGVKHLLLCTLWCCVFTIATSAAAALAAVPASPTGLSVISGNTEASLTWNPVNGASSFAVYRSAGIAGPFTFVGQSQVNGLSNLGLTNGSTYYYAVSAINADGQSSYTSPVSATPTLLALKAPTNIRVHAGNGEVTLTWDKVTSAVGYNVYRISPAGVYTLLTPSASGTCYTDRSVVNGSRYHYVVQTMSTNPGAYSYTVAAYPSASVPRAPASVTAVAGSTWARISWQSSSGASQYLVYGANVEGGPYTYRGSVTTTTFDDKGLVNGTTYYYVVAAVNDQGISAFSPETAASVSALMMPDAAVLSILPRDKGATLSWTAAPGAVSYAVYRKRQSDGIYPAEPVMITTNKGFTDTGLVNGARYNYVVESRNASSDQPLSNEVTVTPVDALPPPVNVVVHPGNTQATITFDPVDGADNYWIQVETSGGVSVESRLVNDFYNTTIGLTNGAIYYFRVRSFSNEPSPYTADIAVMPSAALPLAPGSLTGEAGNRQVSLRWGEVVGATGYRVFRRTDTSGWQFRASLPSSQSFFNDTGLVNGTNYHYTVAAVNDNGTGAWSTTVHVYTPSNNSYFAPGNVEVIPGNTQVTAVWKPATGAATVSGALASYFLQIAETPGGPSVKTGTASNGKSSYTFTGLTNDRDYYVRVRTGSSSIFTADRKVTPGTGLPQAPTSLTAVVGNTQVSLTWPSVGTAIGYNVYRRTLLDPLPARLVGYVDKPFFLDSGLDNGTQYFYSVAAVNNHGSGPMTANEASAQPMARMALAPAEIAGIPGYTQATITWDPVVGATSYYVTLATSPGGPRYTSGTTTNGKTSATFSNLTNGMTYYARVNSSGQSASAEYGETSVTPSISLPLAPASVSCLASGNTQATVSWSTVDGASAYRLYRRTIAGPWTTVPVANATSTRFTDNGLTNGITYYYVAAAERNGNSGAWSGQEVSCSPSGEAPLAPTNLNAVAGDRQVNLTWNAVAGATSYRVLRLAYAGGPIVTSYSANSPQYLVTNLDNKQPYYFCVQAKNSISKWSAYSNELFAIPGSFGFMTVNSTGASAVAITANPSTYGDTTNYTKTNIPNGTQITLIAPTTSGEAMFNSWSGCDSTNQSTRTCTVTMNDNKTVTVQYGDARPATLPGVMLLLLDEE